jgi:hypothetical protein
VPVRPVVVLVLHAEAPEGAGPLTRALDETRRSLARVQLEAWRSAGADEAEIVAGPPDGQPFGERLAREARRRFVRGGGLIVTGSGSIPLAGAADLRRFVEAAADPGSRVLTNNRYSADVVAVSDGRTLRGLPPLPADNALPRWLEERAGAAVEDLRSNWRLGVDVDTPLDLLLLGGRGARQVRSTLATADGPSPRIEASLAALTEILSNRRAELLVAGRVSATTLRWLEDGAACRVRALVEERGLRAATRLAMADEPGRTGRASARPPQRPPRSVLGELLDHNGPDDLAGAVARLADAAVIDTRVLLAHRLGAEESRWPAPEDRYASDLLLSRLVGDPWLRALTASASLLDHPIVLGGHTLVNGGLRLLAQRARTAAR